MTFHAAVKYALDAETNHRLRLCLTSEDGTLCFVIPEGVGPYVHLLTGKLKGANWQMVRNAAFLDFGSLQELPSIDLDADDLHHIKPYRVSF